MKPAVVPERVLREQPDRGREAEQPADIPHKGWWDVLWRVKTQIDDDNVSIVAAGLGLFALLALFPSLAATVAIYGLFSSPQVIAVQVQSFGGLIPQAGLQFLEQQLNQLMSDRGTLSISVVISILLALWSARQGMTALMSAMNVAYNERERRGLFRRLFVSLGFTVGAVLAFIAFVLLGVAVPLLLSFLPLGAAAEAILFAVRWALLWGVASFGLSLVYRYAPSRSPARWQWVSWGSGIAATLWILSSIAFSVYVRHFSSFSKAYGALAGIIVTLMWFYISGFVVILGAEINSELERQTVKDTTEGPPKPMGERGAFSADTIGPRAGAS
jgi:membrane protein